MPLVNPDKPTGNDHGNLLASSLLDDDHTQYALLAGRATPQQMAFGTASGASTGYLTSTAHATKGKYFLNAAGTITVDDLNVRLGIGTATPAGSLQVSAAITDVSASDFVGAVSATAGLNLHHFRNTVTLNAASGTQNFIRGVPTYIPTQDFSGIIIGLNNNLTVGSAAANAFAMSGNISANNMALVTGAGYTGTITRYMNLKINDGTLNGAAAVTTQAGIVLDQLSIATNNILLSMGQANPPSSGNWAIYNASTYANYLLGNTAIGAITAASKLDVSETTGGILTLSRADTSAVYLDSIGKLQWWNSDTQLTTQKIFGNIEMIAAQDITTDAAVGDMLFRTTGTTAGGSPTERMRILNNGNITIADKGTLGSELITDGAFATGTGWTFNSPWVNDTTNFEADKTSNGTGTLTTSPTIVVGRVYKLSYEIKNWTVATVTPSVGGVTLPASLGANGTYTADFVATATTALAFTPTNASRLSIDNVSLKEYNTGNLTVGGTTYLNTGVISGSLSVTGTSGLNDTVTIADAKNIVLNTTTGTKIGTGTTQKLGFWNATPVVQQATSAYTPDTESVAYTGIDNLQAGTPYAQVTDVNALRVAYDNLRTSYDDLLTKLKNTGIVS